MGVLKTALDETHPGHTIDVDAVMAWLDARDLYIADNWKRRQDRESAERRTKAAAEARERYAALPAYTGKITECMGSITRYFGPGRCHQPPKKLAFSQDGTPGVFCPPHAREPFPRKYSGWGGDPHPVMPTIEPDQLIKLGSKS